MNTQRALKIIKGEIEELILPSSDEEVSPGIKWGSFDTLFSPAFWVTQVWQLEEEDIRAGFRLGSCLKEEVAACLLGGHGIPSEVGNAAFRHMKLQGCFDEKGKSKEYLYTTLKTPLRTGDRTIRYRFARKKADYLHDALNQFDLSQAPVYDAQKLRDWLLKIKGIGLKTASWIVRNWLASDEVAILDIHIYRAGLLAGFFHREHDVSKHYYEMEDLYLSFAKNIGVKASLLDAVIWKNMKWLNHVALKQIASNSSRNSYQLPIFIYSTTDQTPTHANQLAT